LLASQFQANPVKTIRRGVLNLLAFSGTKVRILTLKALL
jgi:hypothetical protein